MLLFTPKEQEMLWLLEEKKLVCRAGMGLKILSLGLSWKLYDELELSPGV